MADRASTGRPPRRTDRLRRQLRATQLGRRVGERLSATRVESPEERFDAVENLSLVEGDLADRDFVLQLLETYEPDTVLHAAAQPSAPYSSINGERALYTQRNNVSMNLNLLHGLAECGLDDALHRDDDDGGIYGARTSRSRRGYGGRAEGR